MITLEIEDEKIEMTPEEWEALNQYEEKRPDLFARIEYGALVRMFLTNYRMAKHSPLAKIEIE